MYLNKVLANVRILSWLTIYLIFVLLITTELIIFTPLNNKVSELYQRKNIVNIGKPFPRCFLFYPYIFRNDTSKLYKLKEKSLQRPFVLVGLKIDRLILIFEKNTSGRYYAVIEFISKYLTRCICRWMFSN